MPNPTPFPGSINRRQNQINGDYPTALDFGVKGDGVKVDDAQMLAGSHLLNSASITVAQNAMWPMVGAVVMVCGAGPGGKELCTTITAFNGATQVTLADPSVGAVSGAVAYWGTDNGPALNALLNTFPRRRVNTLQLPEAIYLTTQEIRCKQRIRIRGESCQTSVIYVGKGDSHAGTVNMHGMPGTPAAIVDWVSGDHFDTTWEHGTTIIVNGVARTINRTDGAGIPNTTTQLQVYIGDPWLNEGFMGSGTGPQSLTLSKSVGYLQHVLVDGIDKDFGVAGSVPAPDWIYTPGSPTLTSNVTTDTGTVNVDATGKIVTWVSGAQFIGSMVGGNITIAGTGSQVTGFVSSTEIHLTTSVGAQTGAAYSAVRNPVPITSSIRVLYSSSAGLSGVSYSIGTDVLRLAQTNPANPAPNIIFRSQVENLTLEGNSHTWAALHLQSAHHTKLLNVRMRNVVGMGLWTQFCICNDYDHLSVSVNDEDSLALDQTIYGGRWRIQPQYGMVFDQLAWQLTTNSSVINNPIVESVSKTGIWFPAAVTMSVHQGTSEGCGWYGVHIGPESRAITLTIDLEVNVLGAARLEGDCCTLHNASALNPTNPAISNAIQIVSGVSNKVDGCFVWHLLVDNPDDATNQPIGTVLRNVIYSGQYVDNGFGTYRETTFCNVPSRSSPKHIYDKNTVRVMRGNDPTTGAMDQTGVTIDGTATNQPKIQMTAADKSTRWEWMADNQNDSNTDVIHLTSVNGEKFMVGKIDNPEGAVTAPPGSVYHSIAAGGTAGIYRKETGTGTTGWSEVSNALGIEI